MLIMIFGVWSALRTPTDIFPNINIPVVSVVFSYTGLPPDDMAGRIVTLYERSLTTTVNDIEHIESQSIPNYGFGNTMKPVQESRMACRTILFRSSRRSRRARACVFRRARWPRAAGDYCSARSLDYWRGARHKVDRG